MHYVIGDVHGQLESLKGLLDKISYNKEEDVLYFVGDYIDWGPDSMGTIKYIMELQKEGQVFCCLGNHELMFIEVVNNKWEMDATRRGKTNYARNRGDKTILELDMLSAEEQKEVIDWVKALPVYFTLIVNNQGYYITHSSPMVEIPPNKTSDDVRWSDWHVEDAVWDRIHFPNSNHLEFHEEFQDYILISGHSITRNHRINKYEHYINVDCGAKVIGTDLWTTENLGALRLEDGAEFYALD